MKSCTIPYTSNCSQQLCHASKGLTLSDFTRKCKVPMCLPETVARRPAFRGYLTRLFPPLCPPSAAFVRHVLFTHHVYPTPPLSFRLSSPRAGCRKVSVFTLYAMAIRSVIATVGQPLKAARERRTDLFNAAQAERGLVGAAAATAADAAVAASAFSEPETPFDDAGGVIGAAVEAYAREVLEPLPFPYLPSVGALLLLVAAAAAHTLLVLGKKWSVRFHAWWVCMSCQLYCLLRLA